MKGCWQATMAVLAEAGVGSIFGLPGDDLEPLGAAGDAAIGFTLCRDQRNAVFMATGYAIQSGDLGVALVGKGPAVTNTVTGLLEARCSAAPVLLLSAGTATDRVGSGAFQELDQIAVIRPMVKWAARVDHPGRLIPMLRRAMLTAANGVPGPVYLELPDHLLDAEIPAPPSPPVALELPTTVGVTDAPLRGAERPIVLVGGGMRHRNTGRRVERFAAAYGAAIACTASGRGAVDESSPLFCGLAGLYTPGPASVLWSETDCVIALGSRLEETATYSWPERIGREVPVVQVNVDAAEFCPDFGGHAVLGDAGQVLDSWLANAPAAPGAWADRVRAVNQDLRDRYRRSLRQMHGSDSLHVAEVLEALDATLPRDRILVQENGLQDMWSYSFPFHACDAGAGSVVPSEQTSLGFGAAAAIGVKRAAPRRPVVAFVGDGAFGLFDADLPTAIEAGGGLLYVVLRNGGYGWLQAQLDQRGGPLPGVSFVDRATASTGARELPGLRQFTVADKASLRPSVIDAWKQCEAGGLAVLNVQVRLEDALFDAAKADGDFPLID